MAIADDLRFAVRSLLRRPSLTVFAALTVGLGVGATTAIFSTLETVVLNPLPYEHGDRFVSLLQKIGSANAFMPPSLQQIEAWSEMDDVLEGVEAWSLRGVTLTGRGETREINAALIRPSFHGFIGREPMLGRTFAPDELKGDGARVVLVSHGLWRRELGGDPGALGEVLALDGEPWTIVGVMPKRTLMPGFGLMAAEVWRPLSDEAARSSAFATGLLREGVDIEQLNGRLAAMPSTAADGSVREGWVGVARLVADDVSTGVRSTLGLLMGAVVLLLLIACVNVSNLLLFRANARRQETAVRAALGGGSLRLVRQLLLESLALAACGGVLGVALAYLGQELILELRPERLAVLDYVRLDGRVLGFALALTFVSGLVFGLVPALQAAGPDALEPLRSGGRSVGRALGSRRRWALVVCEVALSFALLLGSLAVLSALSRKQQADVGYRSERVAVMQITLPSWKYQEAEDRRPVLEAIRERTASLPGVVSVSLASGAPPRAGVLFGEVTLEGGEPLEGMQMLHGPSIDTEYFTTLGQRILQGRTFEAADLERGEDLMIVGETTAQTFFPGGGAVGRRFRLSEEGDWITVIGVVEDVAMTGLSTATRPLQVYHPPHPGRTDVTVLARTTTGQDPRNVLPILREIAVSLDPEVRIDRLATADEMMKATLDRERFTTTIMTTFAALALVLAAIGLYGVVSQTVGQRTREIGIRMALGARAGSISSMVLRGAGGATLLGIVGGVGLTTIATRLVEDRIPDLQSTSPITYLAAAAALALTALLAAFVPARRASRVDPVDAIRAE